MKLLDASLLAVTGVLVALAAPTAIEIGTLAYRGRQPPKSLGPAPGFTDLLADVPQFGGEGATLDAVLFFDYDCPACRTGKVALDGLIEEYSNMLSLTVRHFPVISDHSVIAARAAFCADEKGRFRPVNDLLLSPDLPPASFASAIPGMHEEAGFDTVEEWMECVEGLESGIAISDDLAKGMALGVSGTPTFLLDGEIFEGGIAAFGRLVKERAK